jgi:hypothetical protein
LNVTFPELVYLARNRDALAANLMVAHNDVVHWDINFIILVHDWEVDSISSFFNVLYSIWMDQGVNDKLCWIPSKRRSFEVKYFYEVLLPDTDFSFPWKSIWRTKVPLRMLFFTWTASLRKSFTLDNL